MEAMGEGERRFDHALLGKQSTKPLKQSGCVAYAHTEHFACPRGRSPGAQFAL